MAKILVNDNTIGLGGRGINLCHDKKKLQELVDGTAGSVGKVIYGPKQFNLDTFGLTDRGVCDGILPQKKRDL
ncbi:MAG: hypothetical protein PHN31_02865 [Candidatus Gracilibacteria bacterium]|nr:hypothetical protein [Candidatus Gracilibacteria bacterium]